MRAVLLPARLHSARLALAAGLALTAGTFASPALAANAKIEAAAKKALDKAQNDYLSMNYGTGAAKLQKALKACGAKNCTPATQAALMRDIGTMLFRKGDKDGAAKMWASAAKLQPGIALNPAYDAPDIRSAFGDATGTGGAPQPTGDFQHTPAAEQKVNTPLPVYVEGGGDGVVRVVVKYKGAGMSEWKRIDLKKVGDGWGGLIPCADVTSGTMRYYIQGLDSSKEPVASSGDAKHPFTVPIKDDISGEPPRLPGKQPPKTCGGGGANADNDCPPDFPGCSKSGASAGANGEDNGSGDENKTEGEGEGEGEGDEKPAPSSGRKRFWIGGMFGVDFMSFPAGNDLCRLDPNTALPANSANIYCTNRDGTDFPYRNDGGKLNGALVQGQSGNTTGGLERANMRLTFAFDYAATANLLLGARVGAIFYPYPGQAAINDGHAPGFGRLYLDIRGTWVFGSDPFAHAGFAPLVFLGGGLQQFASDVSAVVTLGPSANNQSGTVNMWRVNGPGFIMEGAGIRWAVTPSFAATAAVRVNEAFGDNGLTLTFGPEIGAQVGF